MLSTVDTGEADTAEAKTPSRMEATDSSPEFQGRFKDFLKE